MAEKIKIITRQQWGANPPKVAFESHFPNKITIHHEGASNPTTLVMKSFRGISTIRSIQDFHQRDISKGGRGWCFSLDTEILTDNGWKDYHSLSILDKIFTVEDGFISNWNKLFFESCEMANIETLNYSGNFTLNHKLVGCKQHSKNYQRMLVSDVISNIKTPYRILTGTNYDGGLLNYSEDYCRLLSIIVCDGSFTKKNNYNSIEISFKKERKINELIRILNTLNFKYTIHTHKIDIGYLVIHISDIENVKKIKNDIFIDNKKSLNWHLLNLQNKCMRAMIDAYLNSDGNVPENSNDKKHRNYSTAFSTVKKNLDILQAMVHLTGNRGKLLVNTPKNGKNKVPLYILSFNPNLLDCMVDFRNIEIIRNINDSWSVDCGGKLLMIRHKGCVQITSNSDIGYHAIIAPSGHIYQGRPFNVKGAHVKSNNTGNIGICLIGNFEVEEPTKEQIASLKALILHLKILFPQLKIPKCIYGHLDFMSTDCPGKHLYPIVFNIKNGKESLV